jgi:hypothetical protein
MGETRGAWQTTMGWSRNMSGAGDDEQDDEASL